MSNSEDGLRGLALTSASAILTYLGALKGVSYKAPWMSVTRQEWLHLRIDQLLKAFDIPAVGCPLAQLEAQTERQHHSLSSSRKQWQ